MEPLLRRRVASSTFDTTQRMHILTISFFTLLFLVCCTETYPWLQQTQDNAIHRDLQQLSLSYQHCHVHIVLFELEVDIHGMHSAYTVTKIRVQDSFSGRLKIGMLAYPKMQHMTAHCQATFQVLPSESHFRKLAQDPFSYACERHGSPELPDEGALAWYRLKQRFSFLIVNYTVPFRDTTAPIELGGSLYVVLRYEGRTSLETGEYNTLAAVTVICEACVQREQNLQCLGLKQCLHLVGQAHKIMTNDGRNIKWAFLGQPHEYNIPSRPNPRVLYCFRSEVGENGRCTLSLRDALLNHIARSLNASLTVFGFHNPERVTTAIVAWSEDSTYLEYAATNELTPLHVYPMISPNESVTSLRFITADGIHHRSPRLAVYSQPLDMGTWLATLGLLFILLVVVITTLKSDNPRLNGGKVLRWGLFWVYGHLLDQSEFPRLRKARTGLRVLISGIIVMSFVLAFAVNNIYRAVLNINYVTGNELLCPWRRLDQLISFSALYVPHSLCMLNRSEYLNKYPEFPEIIRLLNGIRQICKQVVTREQCGEPIDEAICTFHDEVESALLRVRSRGPSCEKDIEKVLLGHATDDASCSDPRIILLTKYVSMFKRFPLPELENHIKNQMTQPGTAFLITERTFPRIWKKFEKAMVEDPSLKFSHNYLTDIDTSLFIKHRSRLLVASNMPESHTRLVTDRINSILASGVWEIWNSLSVHRANERRFERPGLPASTPISIKHDGIYVLLLLTGALTALSLVSFVGSVCFKMVSKMVLPTHLTVLTWKPTKVRRLPSRTRSHEITTIASRLST